MVDDAENGARSAEDGGSAFARASASGQIPDTDLLRRYAGEQSEAAFAELVRRYLDLVYSAALRQVGGDAHRAHDVAQVVFATLARKAGSLTCHPALVGWLYTTTQLAAAKVRRSEARRRTRELKAHAMMNESSSSPAPEIDWDRMRPVLDDAMRALSDRDRAAVLLRYFAHRPFAEIGATLNVSEDGARMRVDRAVDKLRGLLTQRGVTSTAAALALALTHQAVASAPAGLAAQVTAGALAGAAAQVTGGLLYFMSTTKFAATVAAGIVLLALGITYREVRRERAAADALADVEHEQALVLARLRTTETQVQQVERELAATEMTLQQARAQPAVPVKTPGPAQPAANVPTADELAAGRAFLERNPAVKKALLERSRARVASRYRPLYRVLGLNAEQIDRFETLMIEGEGVNMGSPDGQLVLRPGTGLTQAEVNDRIHELLGDEGFRQFQEASRQVGARGTTLQVAGALYFTDTPLTAAQSDLLAQAIDGGRADARQSRDAEAYWTSLLAKTQGFLSAPQIAVLAGLRQQQDFERALNEARARWSLPGWGGAPTAGGEKP